LIRLFTTLCAIGFGTPGNAQTLPDPVDDILSMIILGKSPKAAA
jgi:hypothetical protein